jgi:hypothetical protein
MLLTWHDFPRHSRADAASPGIGREDDLLGPQGTSGSP